MIAWLSDNIGGIDIDAWTAAAAEFKARTGRDLALGEYLDLQEASPQTPFLATLLAAEFAREEKYREELAS